MQALLVIRVFEIVIKKKIFVVVIWPFHLFNIRLDLNMHGIGDLFGLVRKPSYRQIPLHVLRSGILWQCNDDNFVSAWFVLSFSLIF